MPNWMIPTTMRRKSGAMSANSTRAWPRSRERNAFRSALLAAHVEPMRAVSARSDSNVSPRFLPDPRLGLMFSLIVPLVRRMRKGELRNAYAGPVEGVTGPAYFPVAGSFIRSLPLSGRPELLSATRQRARAVDAVARLAEQVVDLAGQEQHRDDQQDRNR